MHHSTHPIIKHKAGLLNLTEELGNVSRACKVMGVSRDTFYRYQELVEEVTENAVTKYATEQPAHGQVRVSNKLRKRGVFVSPSGVRSIWLGHNLESFKKHLKALEAKVAQEGILANLSFQTLFCIHLFEGTNLFLKFLGMATLTHRSVIASI